MEKLLTISEAATLINVHTETLRRWDREGTLVALKVNERGDRRYRESDLLEFMNVNPGLIRYGQIVTHGGYSIKWDSEGFLSMSANFGLIARIVAYNDQESFIGFAFAVAGLDLFARTDKKGYLDKLAFEKVKEYVDKKTLSNENMYTFEFSNGRFYEKQNPEWWHGKYSKALVPGLRVEASATHPTTTLNKAWRVILNFKSKSGDSWVKNYFGPNGTFQEYFVWVDSKELALKELPSSAKGAEVLAVDFAVKRFEETKDKDGVREISRIGENNVACFGGKCIKDSLLPEDLMS